MENKEQKVQPKNKRSNSAKLPVMRWLDYPEQKPNLGEEVVVCYPSKVREGVEKREIVEWTFKTMNNAANNPELKFKFIRLPAIA